ncbi:hypothetical protein [Serinicoccus marinus]|uniref:hypothetical protein n=1 Tax=Serinicoccus marinus TaxID=247333 RepID=UPI00187808A8|nr:hypothetical protein [Serinicoccus marinus]
MTSRSTWYEGVHPVEDAAGDPATPLEPPVIEHGRRWSVVPRVSGPATPEQRHSSSPS